MRAEQEQLMRVLLKAQQAVLDWGEELASLQPSPALQVLEQSTKDFKAAVKKLEKSR